MTDRDYTIKKLQLLPKMIEGTTATMEFFKISMQFMAERKRDSLDYLLDNYGAIISEQEEILKKWTDLCSAAIEEMNRINRTTINNKYNGQP